jgi:hypothetical protein
MPMIIKKRDETNMYKKGWLRKWQKVGRHE